MFPYRVRVIEQVPYGRGVVRHPRGLTTNVPLICTTLRSPSFARHVTPGGGNPAVCPFPVRMSPYMTNSPRCFFPSLCADAPEKHSCYYSSTSWQVHLHALRPWLIGLHSEYSFPPRPPRGSSMYHLAAASAPILTVSFSWTPTTHNQKSSLNELSRTCTFPVCSSHAFREWCSSQRPRAHADHIPFSASREECVHRMTGILSPHRGLCHERWAKKAVPCKKSRESFKDPSRFCIIKKFSWYAVTTAGIMNRPGRGGRGFTCNIPKPSRRRLPTILVRSATHSTP